MAGEEVDFICVTLIMYAGNMFIKRMPHESKVIIAFAQISFRTNQEWAKGLKESYRIDQARGKCWKASCFTKREFMAFHVRIVALVRITSMTRREKYDYRKSRYLFSHFLPSTFLDEYRPFTASSVINHAYSRWKLSLLVRVL